MAERIHKSTIKGQHMFPLGGMRQWANPSIAALLLLLPPIVLAQQSRSKTQMAQRAGKELIARNGNGEKDVHDRGTNDGGFVIGPQDVLNITVWKETEISQTVMVRPDGMISLPLVNDVQAEGVTPTQLATSITARLREFLTDPQVTVVVKEINSQRIYVLGEVIRAGAYPLFPGMTFLQALSSAGGFTQFANVKKIYLLRTENGRRIKIPLNYKDVVNGRATGQDLVVKTGDTIVVP